MVARMRKSWSFRASRSCRSSEREDRMIIQSALATPDLSLLRIQLVTGTPVIAMIIDSRFCKRRGWGDEATEAIASTACQICTPRAGRIRSGISWTGDELFSAMKTTLL
ncbi:hypothetical protein NPIL_535941 [Nephila pilipes]|uniref:Uncharacterized protein n=1 Tax=Nephila pilipes TaxID=299642 RepID=A0A8X6NJ50_NEPPI|nr:hypothetical protein NPIL_535941 [Nephila pilipes]